MHSRWGHTRTPGPVRIYYKMPSKSSQINRSLRIEAGGEHGDTDMRQLIMELTRAQSAAAPLLARHAENTRRVTQRVRGK